MPRPCKRRRICALPSICQFGPKTAADAASSPVFMTLDEFETIRLIDLEGMTQEQCAAQMDIARTTAQAIYGSARKKIAECIVNGLNLQISGGDYVLCNGRQDSRQACGHRCWKEIAVRRTDHMKIAVTYENGQVFQHFGHTEYFKVYVADNGKVISSEVVSTNGSGHGALAEVLRSLGVQVLICGGIGGGARMALADAGISLYGGVHGEADQAVAAFLDGSLTYNPDEECDHHGHEHHGEGHDCGRHGDHGEGHGCGNHSCGGHDH